MLSRNSGTQMPDHKLDAKDLMCPLPVLRARKAMKQLDIGDVLEIEATDPGALKDFPAFCEATGHTLLHAEQDGPVFVFRIRKTA